MKKHIQNNGYFLILMMFILSCSHSPFQTRNPQSTGNQEKEIVLTLNNTIDYLKNYQIDNQAFVVFIPPQYFPIFLSPKRLTICTLENYG